MVHRARLETEQRKVNAGCSEGIAGLNKGTVIPPRSSEQTTFFLHRAFAGCAPIYSQEHWDQLRQFTSVVTFTYRVVR